MGFLDGVTVTDLKQPLPELGPMPEGLTPQQVCVGAVADTVCVFPTFCEEGTETIIEVHSKV